MDSDKEYSERWLKIESSIEPSLQDDYKIKFISECKDHCKNFYKESRTILNHLNFYKTQKNNIITRFFNYFKSNPKVMEKEESSLEKSSALVHQTIEEIIHNLMKTDLKTKQDNSNLNFQIIDNELNASKKRILSYLENNLIKIKEYFDNVKIKCIYSYQKLPEKKIKNIYFSEEKINKFIKYAESRFNCIIQNDLKNGNLKYIIKDFDAIKSTLKVLENIIEDLTK